MCTIYFKKTTLKYTKFKSNIALKTKLFTVKIHSRITIDNQTSPVYAKKNSFFMGTAHLRQNKKNMFFFISPFAKI
jgi:hypothetical protein